MRTLLITLVLALPAAFAHPVFDKGSVLVPDSIYPEESALIDVIDAFDAKYGYELKGKTTEGLDCNLAMMRSFPDARDVQCYGTVFKLKRRTGYISLNTYANVRGGETSIGFSVNPDCTLQGPYEVKRMDIGSRIINVDIFHTEFSEKIPIENNLIIKMDADGDVVSASGSSSYWPASTCMFKKPDVKK
jgi:hypothetical protein